MCKNCKGELKLISYQWNNDEILYKYRCDDCGEIFIVSSEYEEQNLKDMICNSNLYNKFNL